jgi:hypothetical protein
MTAKEMAAQREGQMVKDQMLAIMGKNADKNFVQRVLNPSAYAGIEIANARGAPQGTVSTHLMMSGETDGGKGIAYPSIFYNAETNSLYQPENPYKEAKARGEIIIFPKATDAQFFAENYKKAWGAGENMAGPIE